MKAKESILNIVHHLKNKFNKLFTKPKHILVATPDDKNTRKPSNDTDEDEKMYSKVQVISNDP